MLQQRAKSYSDNYLEPCIQLRMCYRPKVLTRNTAIWSRVTWFSGQ